MAVTEKDYESMVLEDILKWYESLDAPSQVPGFSELSVLMREARIVVDARRQREAKEINEELRREWDETAGAGVR